MRRNWQDKILSLDINACHYALNMIVKGVDFSVAIQSAEKEQKKRKI